MWRHQPQYLSSLTCEFILFWFLKKSMWDLFCDSTDPQKNGSSLDPASLCDTVPREQWRVCDGGLGLVLVSFCWQDTVFLLCMIQNVASSVHLYYRRHTEWLALFELESENKVLALKKRETTDHRYWKVQATQNWNVPVVVQHSRWGLWMAEL